MTEPQVPRRNRALIAIAIVFALTPGGPSQAQVPDEEGRWETATWVDDLNFASANILLGGLTGGITSYLRGGSFSRGFTRGALGGGVGYFGKRITSARFEGAGLLGRQIGAVGGSIVRNSSLEAGILDSLIIPLGPIRAHISPFALGRTTFRVDLHEASWLAYALTVDRLDIDWRRTLSAGAPVFMTNSAIRNELGRVNGVTAGGLIVLSRRSSSALQDVLAHERVHITQVDFLKASIGYPLESWARHTTGLTRFPLLDHVLVGLAHGLVQYPLSGAWGRSRDLFEVEAEFLEAR